MSTKRQGMTLVELLTVITILVILIAVAVPAMRPQLKDRKLREASRMLNTFIAAAKAKAVETGRPHGIAIARDPNNANASFQIYLAETPPPYAGEVINDTAQLAQGAAAEGYANQATITDSLNLVGIDDFIQFGFKGPKYRITNVSGSKTVTFEAPSGTSYPRLTSATPAQARVPYQVFRKPMRSSSQPLTLPTGTVIDLYYSGIGTTGTQMASAVAGSGDVIITFTPNGSIDRVSFPFTLPGTIHLLVGRVEQTEALETDYKKHNIADGTTSWVSLGHLTGQVTTAENAFVPDEVITADAATILVQSRRIAQQKQTMGGR